MKDLQLCMQVDATRPWQFYHGSWCIHSHVQQWPIDNGTAWSTLPVTLLIWKRKNTTINLALMTHPASEMIKDLARSSCGHPLIHAIWEHAIGIWKESLWQLPMPWGSTVPCHEFQSAFFDKSNAKSASRKTLVVAKPLVVEKPLAVADAMRQY